MKVAWTNVAVGVLLLCAGYSLREPGETVVITHVDTVPYAAFRDSLNTQRLEADGLRAKLAGRERLAPRTIVRTDTLVSPPDTVLQLVNIGRGILTVAPLVKTDSLWRPELHRYDVGACDDGWSWNAGELVCDKARLGHLSVTLAAGVALPIWEQGSPGLASTAGVEWTSSNRSPWRASMATDLTGRASLTVTRSLRLF